MSTRTYTRTYLTEVTETYTFTDEDLTPDQVAMLDDFHDKDMTELTSSDVDDIITQFDADHEDISWADDHRLTIERTR